MGHDRPHILFSANRKLFESFVTPEHERQLATFSEWERASERTVTAAFRRRLQNIDGLITTWDSPQHFPDELLDWAPNLKIIAHCGGAVKCRFAPSLFDRLVITNAASPMARHVAELAVTLLLYFARQVDDYRLALRRRSNDIYDEMHISGGGDQTILNREVGMIGFGRIGRAIVELLAPFGTRFNVYDPYVATSNLLPNVRSRPLNDVLSTSKFLVVVAGLTEETFGMLNRKTLSMLPSGSAVINVARGGIIDLDALTKLVLNGRLRCALDVTDPQEPLAISHPLRRAPGAILTPHVGAISRSVRHEITSIVLADLERFFSGNPVENRVTAAMLDRMT